MANRNNDGNGTAFNVLRILQVLTLIPAWALLAAVMSNYNSNDEVTPSSIQFVFAITLILSIWSFCILITFLRAKNTALWMTFFDILGMALLIAGVVWLSNIANVDCVAVTVVTNNTVYQRPNNDDVITDPMNNIPSDLNPDEKFWNTKHRLMARFLNSIAKRQNYNNGNIIVEDDRPLYMDDCGKIKAAWGLAIANIILFFISAIFSAIIYKNNQEQPVIREKIIVDSPMPPPPVIPAPAPVYPEHSVYGGNAAGGRRHSRSSTGGGRSHRHHRSSRSSRRGSDYYV